MRGKKLADAEVSLLLAKSDIRTDTTLSYYFIEKDTSGKYKAGTYVAMSKKSAQEFRHLPWTEASFKYHSPVYTHAYTNKVVGLINEYQRLKHLTTNMRYDNWNYSTAPMDLAKAKLDPYISKKPVLERCMTSSEY